MLGVDASGINEKWSKLSPGVNLIKFGGGESTSGQCHNQLYLLTKANFPLQDFTVEKLEISTS
jgi:hypothetical protein